MLKIAFISYLLIIFPGFLETGSLHNFPQTLISEVASSPKPCVEIKQVGIDSESWKAVLESLQGEIKKQNCLDTQTAFALIEKVINNNAENYYPLAEQIYYQALNTKDAETNLDLIKEEARRILPLLTDEEAKNWEKKIETDDQTLVDDLKNFWKLRDPVLSTSANERLREHWQRIAYARKEFTRNEDAIYGTDDRGTIFVRFGPPSYKRTGMLFPDNTEIRSKLYDLSYFKGGISPREMFNLNMSIKQQYMPKYYEVWVYRNFGSPRPVLYIFGESANRGTFGLRKSVEEFIPSGSFRMGISSSRRFGTGPRGLTAGPLLQMALYNELSTVDIFFGNQLTYYDQNWYRYMNGNLNYSALRMMNNSSRAERELKRNQKQAPDELSTIENRLNYVQQSHRTFRFLDENNEAVNKILVFSTPQEKLIARDETIFQNLNPRYVTHHAARIINARGREIFSDIKTSEVSKKTESPRASLLEIPANNTDKQKGLTTLLLSSEISREPQVKTTRKKVIIASSVNEVSDISTLAKETGTFKVSDIIWGYKATQINHETQELEFYIPEKLEVPKGKNLAMYFETYHLTNENDAKYDYQMDYYIHKKKRRKYRDTGITLTLNFTPQHATSKETLEVKTSDLEAGRYRITCEFKKDGLAAPVVRFIEFEITE